ncbi:MAG TPA: energy transducer TonB [Puia sp.]
MEPLAILQADPLDLLFENRNKSYGAYPLRKYYPQRLLISMGIILSLVVLITFIWLYPYSSVSSARKLIYVTGDIIPEFVKDEVKFPPPHVRASVPKPPATVALTRPVIVADRNIQEPMPTVDKIETSSIGTKTIAGPPDNGEPPSNGKEAGLAVSQTTESVENKNEVLYIAEIMPEFPGGPEALKKFLIRNLRMPENNLEEGAEVKVIARFVVGADGRVRDIEITLPADAAFNTEVKRVISKMPDWKPGSQNHRNVSVYFSLPVNFVRPE